MGILFVLAFWAVVGTFIAAIGTKFARKTAAFLLRSVNDDARQTARARLIKSATILPIVCLIWAGLIFLFQAVINTSYRSRDIGIGDEFYCPLPNGYSLLMIDVGDDGEILRSPDASEASREGAIEGVRELQISGSNIFGGSDSQSFQHFGQDSISMDRYFAVDTRSGKATNFANEEALRVSASQLGVTLKLEPIFKVYRRYRFTWFDGLATALLFLPPAAAAGFILRSIIRLRTIGANPALFEA